MSPTKSRGELFDVPQPKAWPILGNLLDLDSESPLQSLIELTKRPEFREAMAMTFGGERNIFVHTSSLLKEICDETRFKKLVHSSLLQLRSVVGAGLFTAHNDEPDWEVAHRVLMPVFGTLKIREMYPQMNDLALQLCLKWARQGEFHEISVADDFTRLTLDTIGLCAMGVRFNSFYAGEDMHPFVNSMVNTLHEADTRAGLPEFVNSVRFGATRNFNKHVDLMRSTARGIVESRRKHPTNSPDLLNAMLEGRDPKTGQRMTDESIIDNMVTFLVAGHETTSGLLSFAFYYMLTNPNVLECAREEVDKIVGMSQLKIEHLAKLSYINAIFRESLRLQPTAPGFSVVSDKDEIIGNKYKIKAKEPITVLLHAVHSDESVYGKDADKFRPERMLDEEFEKLPPGAWKPFGNGMRACIGRAFAWQEALLTTAIILQNFDIKMADPDYKLRIKETLTIKPDGFKIRVKPRHGIDALQLATNLAAETALAAESFPISHLTPPSSINTIARREITILYASNMGTCAALAQRLATYATGRGFSIASIKTLNSAVETLPQDHPVIILTASYEGKPADDAREFFGWLESLSKEQGPLSNVSYAVFGCGHRDWAATLYRIPKLVDSLLKASGADRLVEPWLADSSTSNLFSDLETWLDQALLPALGTKDAEQPLIPKATNEISIGLPYHVQMHNLPIKGTVVMLKKLTLPQATVQKYHIELRLPEATRYMAGDHVILLPSNSDSAVRKILRRFHLSQNSTINVPDHYSFNVPIGTTVSEYLRSYVDLTQTATPSDVQTLAKAASTTSSLKALQTLSRENYEVGIRRAHASVVDLLYRYPDIQLPFEVFISLLQALRTRTYSVSSAMINSNDKMSLTLSVLNQPSWSEPSQRYLGVCSNYLAGLSLGDAFYLNIKRNKKGFCLPEDDQVSIVMIAAGSGFAPFRGFLQQLTTQASGKASTSMLFFGCRGPEDDIYREELDAAEKLGVVKVIRAYSQSTTPGITRGYVQDAMRCHRDSLTHMWLQKSKFMVCGSVQMVEEVKAVVKSIAEESFQNQGGQKEADTDWFSNFEPDRYISEAFI